MNIINYIIIISLWLVSSSAIAKETSLKCTPTPSLPLEQSILHQYNHLNNLAKEPGDAEYRPGEIIYLYGKILDESCVPVSDAIIEIWESYPNNIEKKKEKHSKKLEISGSTVSNNLGEFQFITIYSPSLHIKIRHSDFKAFYNRINFAKLPNQLNLDLPSSDAIFPIADKIFYYNVVLNGKNKYRKY